MDDNAASIEMPRYQSHKQVHALKIASVTWTMGDCVLRFMEPGYAALKVPPAYANKHDPQPGGYYVVYDDGYASWSPAETFEAGYTRI